MKYSFLTSWQWIFAAFNHSMTEILNRKVKVCAESLLYLVTARLPPARSTAKRLSPPMWQFVSQMGCCWCKANNFFNFPNNLLWETSRQHYSFYALRCQQQKGPTPKAPHLNWAQVHSWDTNRRRNVLSRFLPYNRTLTLFGVATWLVKKYPPKLPCI